jgi:hypothetical protein
MTTAIAKNRSKTIEELICSKKQPAKKQFKKVIIHARNGKTLKTQISPKP